MMYWSCSKFADKLRGTAKPAQGLTSEGWDDWEKEAKAAHPVRFWLTETALDTLNDVFLFPSSVINRIRHYIKYRFFTKNYRLPSRLKKGVGHEVDTRMLHCMFETLVDYVEVELAYMNVLLDKNARIKYNTPLWYRWGAWRNSLAGLEYLTWQIQENVPGAQETYDLYVWWNHHRPLREEAHKNDWENMDVSSLDDIKRISAAEQDNHNEDTEKLIRLIQIRSELWT